MAKLAAVQVTKTADVRATDWLSLFATVGAKMQYIQMFFCQIYTYGSRRLGM